MSIIDDILRENPDILGSVDDELTEMTRFGVHLQVDVETKELPVIGSPMDWEWGRMVDKYMGGDALTHVDVRSVTIESNVTVDEDFNVVETRTYTVFDQVAPSIPATVTLPREVVEDTLMAFAEGVAWSNEQRGSYTKLAEAVGMKAPVEGDEHHE